MIGAEIAQVLDRDGDGLYRGFVSGFVGRDDIDLVDVVAVGVPGGLEIRRVEERQLPIGAKLEQVPIGTPRS